MYNCICCVFPNIQNSDYIFLLMCNKLNQMETFSFKTCFAHDIPAPPTLFIFIVNVLDMWGIYTVENGEQGLASHTDLIKSQGS